MSKKLLKEVEALAKLLECPVEHLKETYKLFINDVISAKL